MLKLCGVLACLFLIQACNNARPNQDLKLGLLVSTSDEWASVGQAIRQGAELAIEEINSAGGVHGKTLTAIVEDSKEASSGANAVTAYHSLRNRGVEFFIGPTGTPAGLSLAPIIAHDPVLFVTPMVGVRDFSDASPNIFNVRGVDETGARAMANAAYARGLTRAAVIASQQPWESTQGKAFAQEFSRIGGSVVAHEESLPESVDLRTHIAKVLAKAPQIIFLSNFNRLPLTSRQLVAAGYSGPKYLALLDQSALDQAQGTLEGAEFATFERPSPAFELKYVARFSDKPNLGADTGYDAVYSIVTAIKLANSLSPSNVAVALQNTSIDGADGQVSFSGGRIANRKVVRFRVSQGSIVPVE